MTGLAFIPRQSARDDVRAYIEQVNATGQAFATQYRDVTKAYSTIGTSTTRGTQAQRLQRAARRLTLLRRRIAAVPAPKQATRLREDLVAFYREQEAVAYEIAGITAYFPALVEAERPLGAAARKMRSMIAAAKAPEAQAAALRSYADELAFARKRIDVLTAPPVLAMAKTAEIARLRRVERSIHAVQKALLKHDRPGLQRAIDSLSIGDTGAAAAATRAGILAYNHHVQTIRKLAARVEQERRELDVTVR